jgi:hypothetical protein
MPCDQIRTVEVEFNEGTDLDALALALEGLGYTAVGVEEYGIEFEEGQFDRRTGRFTFQYGEEKSREVISRAYTKATVLNQSDKFGWVAKTATKALAFAGFSRKW